jgi:hypothetical protein
MTKQQNMSAWAFGLSWKEQSAQVLIVLEPCLLHINCYFARNNRKKNKLRPSNPATPLAWKDIFRPTHNPFLLNIEESHPFLGFPQKFSQTYQLSVFLSFFLYQNFGEIWPTPPPSKKAKLVKFTLKFFFFLNFFVKKWWNFATKKNSVINNYYLSIYLLIHSKITLKKKFRPPNPAILLAITFFLHTYTHTSLFNTLWTNHCL